MGGITFLKAIAAPYLSMRFMPTGGITAENIAPYLAFDRVVACGGSWMAPADRIRAGDFAWIRSEADKAARLVPARDGAKR
jgi:2-dehydro-3-deoxyphosphogluconate aldolase/(4S)-4-hydroxy-2-oxoglutarate aldolase